MLNLIEFAHERMLGPEILLQQALASLKDLRSLRIFAHLLKNLTLDQVRLYMNISLNHQLLLGLLDFHVSETLF